MTRHLPVHGDGVKVVETRPQQDREPALRRTLRD